MERKLIILADGEETSLRGRFSLRGRSSLNLYPEPFLLEGWNLREPDFLLLSRAKTLTVLQGTSCIAFGQAADVTRATVPEGTVTTAVFAPGLDLWERKVSLSVSAGTPVSEAVRAILAASGTGISLLSFPGRDPLFPRARAFLGRAAECAAEALSAAGAQGVLAPAGLCVSPEAPLPVTLRLTARDLTDAPAFAEGGRKMLLSTEVKGFRPGEELLLETESMEISGKILERKVDADTGAGPWKTMLTVEVRR